MVVVVAAPVASIPQGTQTHQPHARLHHIDHPTTSTFNPPTTRPPKRRSPSALFRSSRRLTRAWIWGRLKSYSYHTPTLARQIQLNSYARVTYLSIASTGKVKPTHHRHGTARRRPAHRDRLASGVSRAWKARTVRVSGIPLRRWRHVGVLRGEN